MLAGASRTEPLMEASVGFPEQALLSGHGQLPCPMVPDKGHRSAVALLDAGLGRFNKPEHLVKPC